MKEQEIALVTDAYWWGDGTVSGILGLAYSALTSAFAGTYDALDNGNFSGTAPGNEVHYSPIVSSMITQGLNLSLFSLSLTRPTNENSSAGGYLAFGGVPPVAVDLAAFVSTPIVPWQYAGCPEAFATNLSYYSILPDAYVYNNKEGAATTHSTGLHAFVDSEAYGLFVSV